MGIGNLGWAEILVIAVFVLIFFGPQRLPEVARSMGHAMREFRRSLNQIQRELEDADPRTHIKRSIYGDEPSADRSWEPTGEKPASVTPPPATATPPPATDTPTSVEAANEAEEEADPPEPEDKPEV